MNHKFNFTKGHKMFSRIIDKFKKIVEPPTYCQQLEEYLAKKNPQHPADIEYWIKEYEYRRGNFYA